MYAKIILYMLHAITITHCNHITEKSYARHVALGEFYTALEPLVDTLAEILSGRGEQLVFQADGFILMGSEEIISEVIKHIELNYLQFPKYSHATLDMIVELCSQTLYKLKRLA